jgi:hypothetical protein
MSEAPFSSNFVLSFGWWVWMRNVWGTLFIQIHTIFWMMGSDDKCLRHPFHPNSYYLLDDGFGWQMSEAPFSSNFVLSFGWWVWMRNVWGTLFIQLHTIFWMMGLDDKCLRHLFIQLILSFGWWVWMINVWAPFSSNFILSFSQLEFFFIHPSIQIQQVCKLEVHSTQPNCLPPPTPPNSSSSKSDLIFFFPLSL